MAKRVLWVVGEPGVGKTTLVRSWMKDAGEPTLFMSPKWTSWRDGKVVAAGHYTGTTFDGADTVPYNGAIAALDFWKQILKPRAELTIFDGDRFSNASVVDFMKEQKDVEMAVLLLVASDPETAAARRRARGSNQSASWVKGRKTKSERFAQLLSKRVELAVENLTPDFAWRALRWWAFPTSQVSATGAEQSSLLSMPTTAV